MKKKTVTALAVVTPKAITPPEVQPKATKADIIKAAVQRAREKHGEEAAAYAAKRDALKAQILEAALVEVSKNLRSLESEVYLPGWGDYVPELRVEVASPKVKALFKAFRELESPGHFDEAGVKQALFTAMDGTADRVSLLLSVPENVAKIDALLKTVFQPTTKTIDQ
jgi:hypothetical protein